jgi:type I restriction enzyme S subunit
MSLLTIPLGRLIYELSERNTDVAINHVFSVTNTDGFIPSDDYFSKQVYSRQTQGYKIVQPGNFAYNPARINVGSIDYLKTGQSVVVSPMYVIFDIFEDLLNRDYLLYFLKSETGLSRINHMTTGSVRDVLSFSDLSHIEIPLPVLDEQEEIVKIIRDAYDLLELREEGENKLEALTQSLFLEMFGDPFDNAKGWNVVTLESLKPLGRSLVRTGPFGSLLKKHEYTKTGIPVWGIDNVKVNDFREEGSLFISRIKYKELINYEVYDGDILVSRAGTTGRMCVAHPKQQPSIIGTNLIKLSLDHDKIVPEFFTTMFSYFSQRVARNIRAGGDGDSYSFINSKDLQGLKIPLPPLSMQKEFHRQLLAVKKIQQNQKSSEENIVILIKSIQARAFSGELTSSWREKQVEGLQLAEIKRDRALATKRNTAPVDEVIEERRIPEEELLRQALGNFAVNVTHLLEPLRQIEKEVVQANQEVMKSLSQFNQNMIEPFLLSMRQSFQNIPVPKLPVIDRDTVISYIDSLPVHQGKRAILETLDTTTLRVLKLAGTYPAYFTPADLETGEFGGITTLQAESSLRVLEALGFVRLVKIDGILRYHLIDEIADYASKPASLSS